MTDRDARLMLLEQLDAEPEQIDTSAKPSGAEVVAQESGA